MRRHTEHVITICAVLAVIAIGPAIFLGSGIYNIDTDGHHWRSTYNLLQTLRDRSIGRHQGAQLRRLAHRPPDADMDMDSGAGHPHAHAHEQADHDENHSSPAQDSSTVPAMQAMTFAHSEPTSSH